MKSIGSLSFGPFLRASALRWPDREAVFDADRRIGRSYRELDERANSLANNLLESGVRKGDFVAVLFRNCAEFVELYYALARIGAVIAPQPTRLSPREIRELVNLSEARILLFDQAFNGIVEAIRPELTTVERYVGLGDDLPGYAYSYEDMATGGSTLEPVVEVGEEDLMYLNYTSGTTNLPKAYLLNHYNNLIAKDTFDIFGLTEEDTVLTVFPMYGRVGFGWSAYSTYKGARNVTLSFLPDRVLQVIEEEKVTFTVLVPIMAQLLWLYAKPEEHDLSSLKKLIFAGSSLPQSVLEEARRRLCPDIYEFYGLQETGIITSMTPEDRLRKPNSVGLPPAGVEMRLVDADDADVAPGEVGEIIMQGPAATTGYFKQPDNTFEVLRGGWFHTGDLGSIDSDGYLYVSGRVKDMIVTGGQNVFAPEVEETLLCHPAVVDVAVIGLPHELWGEQVTAVVVLSEGYSMPDEGDVLEAELIEFCKERAAHFKAPKRVMFAAELPRNLAMKVKKFELVEKYCQRVTT